MNRKLEEAYERPENKFMRNHEGQFMDGKDGRPEVLRAGYVDAMKRKTSNWTLYQHQRKRRKIFGEDALRRDQTATIKFRYKGMLSRIREDAKLRRAHLLLKSVSKGMTQSVAPKFEDPSADRTTQLVKSFSDEPEYGATVVGIIVMQALLQEGLETMIQKKENDGEVPFKVEESRQCCKSRKEGQGIEIDARRRHYVYHH